MNPYIAELIGTFLLVFLGTGATALGIAAPPALVFGLVIMALVILFGRRSGAHFNPGVTMAHAMAGKLSGDEVLPYIQSQFAGAFIASTLVGLFTLPGRDIGVTLPGGVGLEPGG